MTRVLSYTELESEEYIQWILAVAILWYYNISTFQNTDWDHPVEVGSLLRAPIYCKCGSGRCREGVHDGGCELEAGVHGSGS